MVSWFGREHLPRKEGVLAFTCCSYCVHLQHSRAQQILLQQNNALSSLYGLVLLKLFWSGKTDRLNQFGGKSWPIGGTKPFLAGSTPNWSVLYNIRMARHGSIEFSLKQNINCLTEGGTIT